MPTSSLPLFVHDVVFLTLQQQQLQHRNIVRAYGIIHEPQAVKIIMEYMPGGSLNSLQPFLPDPVHPPTPPIPSFNTSGGSFSSEESVEILQREPLHVDLAVMYARDILSGLEYLHNNNIVHRDIKPHNVLLSADGVCKLSDFGTAKYIPGKTQQQTHSLQGTPIYMAPELLAGRPTCASDIWSFGLTVLFLVTGIVFTKSQQLSRRLKPFIEHIFCHKAVLISSQCRPKYPQNNLSFSCDSTHFNHRHTLP